MLLPSILLSSLITFVAVEAQPSILSIVARNLSDSTVIDVNQVINSAAEYVATSLGTQLDTAVYEDGIDLTHQKLPISAAHNHSSRPSIAIAGLQFVGNTSNDAFSFVQTTISMQPRPVEFIVGCSNDGKNETMFCEDLDPPAVPVMAGLLNVVGAKLPKPLQIEAFVGQPPFDKIQVPDNWEFVIRHDASQQEEKVQELGKSRVEAQARIQIEPYGGCRLIVHTFQPLLREVGFDWTVNLTGAVGLAFRDAVQLNTYSGDGNRSKTWAVDVGQLLPTIKGRALTDRLDHIHRNSSVPGASLRGTVRLRLVVPQFIGSRVENMSDGACWDRVICPIGEPCTNYNASYALMQEHADAFLRKGLPLAYAGETCGGFNGGICRTGLCCGGDGVCSKTPAACGVSCQAAFGRCDPPPSLGEVPNFPSNALFAPNTTDPEERFLPGRVGPRYRPLNTTGFVQTLTGEVVRVQKPGTSSRCGSGVGICGHGECCSPFGVCTTEREPCSNLKGCQEAYGACDTVPQEKRMMFINEAEQLEAVSEGKRCGMGQGICNDGSCCGSDNMCRYYNCYEGCLPQYGACNVLPVSAPNVAARGNDSLPCGPDVAVCPLSMCCSAAGLCGTTAEHCGGGCQPRYGLCSNSSMALGTVFAPTKAATNSALAVSTTPYVVMVMWLTCLVVMLM